MPQSRQRRLRQHTLDRAWCHIRCHRARRSALSWNQCAADRVHLNRSRGLISLESASPPALGIAQVEPAPPPLKSGRAVPLMLEDSAASDQDYFVFSVLGTLNVQFSLHSLCVQCCFGGECNNNTEYIKKVLYIVIFNSYSVYIQCTFSVQCCVQSLNESLKVVNSILNTN